MNQAELPIQRRLVAFVRTIANQCTRCYHGDRETCRTCAAQSAKLLLADLAAASRPATDYSLGARMRRILAVLKQSGRPLSATQILRGRELCSYQLKQYTLKRMVKKGLLRRNRVATAGGNCKYTYSITPKGLNLWNLSNPPSKTTV